MDGTKLGDDIIVVETSNEAFRRSESLASHSRYYYSISHDILTLVDITMMIEIDITGTEEMMIATDIESVLIVGIVDSGPDPGHQEDIIADMMIIHIHAMIDIIVMMYAKRVVFSVENLDT